MMRKRKPATTNPSAATGKIATGADVRDAATPVLVVEVLTCTLSRTSSGALASFVGRTASAWSSLEVLVGSCTFSAPPGGPGHAELAAGAADTPCPFSWGDRLSCAASGSIIDDTALPFCALSWTDGCSVTPRKCGTVPSAEAVVIGSPAESLAGLVDGAVTSFLRAFRSWFGRCRSADKSTLRINARQGHGSVVPGLCRGRSTIWVRRVLFECSWSYGCRGIGCFLSGGVLRPLIRRAQIPTFALVRRINTIVPMAALRRGRIRFGKTITRPCSVRPSCPRPRPIGGA